MAGKLHQEKSNAVILLFLGFIVLNLPRKNVPMVDNM